MPKCERLYRVFHVQIQRMFASAVLTKLRLRLWLYVSIRIWIISTLLWLELFCCPIAVPYTWALCFATITTPWCRVQIMPICIVFPDQTNAHDHPSPLTRLKHLKMTVLVRTIHPLLILLSTHIPTYSPVSILRLAMTQCVPETFWWFGSENTAILLV